MAATGMRRAGGWWRTAVRRMAVAAAAAVLAVSVAGCDYFAEKKLVVGQHTEEDVRKLMGKPDIVWEEENGARKLEYPRGPMGTQTYFVHIGPDGRYLGMERALVPANFAKVQVGMSQDDVRRILGRETERTPYELSKEEVWSWRYEGDAQATMFFNAHFDQASRRVKRITRIEDWRTQGAP
jgi:hypothetical protein